MAHESSLEDTSSNQINFDSSDSTIGINIKTLDSQLYSFRVKKKLPVPALKEQIATTIGVPLEQQRLIYRGKVLKDDQFLSDHSVEDGDTLHLVARPQVQSQHTSSAAASNASRTSSQANDSGTGSQQGRVGHVAHSVILGTVNIGDRHGEAMPIDLSQIVPAVLNFLGAQNIGATGGPNLAPIVSTSNQVHSSTGTQGSQNTSQTQSGSSANGGFICPNQPLSSSTQFSQMPTRGAVNQHMVISDALTTLSEFIDRMQRVLPNSNNSLNNEQHQQHSVTSSLDARGLPTPEFLSYVLERTQLLLRENAIAALSHVSTRLQREGNSSDPSLRAQIQTEAMQLGVAMQHLGAMLLELGRVTMTLRMGQTPAESSVYAGPAVYISPAGPNPIMVQPFPFQASSLFGISSPPSVSELLSRGTGDPSNSINIHLHTGSSAPLGASSNGGIASPPEAIQGEHLNVEQTTDRNGSSDSISTRLPSRTEAATIQTRAVPVFSRQVFSAVYPFNVRAQQSVPISSASDVFSARWGPPNETNFIAPPSLGSDSFPVLVSEVTAPIPMEPTRNAPVQSSSMPSSTTDHSHVSVNTDTQSNMVNSALQPPVGYNDTMHTTELNLERNDARCCDSQPQNSVSRLVTSVRSSNRDDNGSSSQKDLLSGNDAYFDSKKVLGDENNKQNSSGENHVFDHSVSRKEEQQIPLKGDQSSFMDSRINFGEPLVANSASSHANCQSGSIPSCSFEVNSFKGEHDSLEVRQSPPSNRTIESQMPAPLGLGVGSLQTKKRSKSVKFKGNGDGQAKASSHDHNQHSFVKGNEASHSLASQTNLLDRENASESSNQFPSLISNFINDMPLGAQTGSGQTDLASMMATAMQSSGFSNLLSGVASHARVPTGDLRSMIEQCVQSPAVQNTLNQLVQQVGPSGDQMSNVGTDQGKFDFKGLFQQILPAVSQALGSSSTSPAAIKDIKSEPLPETKDVQTCAVESLSYSDYQADLSQALERIEQNDDPRNIFEALLRISGRLYGEQTIYQDIAELGNDEDLTNEFMEILRHDIRRKLAKEPDSKDKS